MFLQQWMFPNICVPVIENTSVILFALWFEPRGMETFTSTWWQCHHGWALPFLQAWMFSFFLSLYGSLDSWEWWSYYNIISFFQPFLVGLGGSSRIFLHGTLGIGSSGWVLIFLFSMNFCLVVNVEPFDLENCDTGRSLMGQKLECLLG